MTTSLRVQPIFENLELYLAKPTPTHRPPPPFLDDVDFRLTENCRSVASFVIVLVDVPLQL
jgi:hypothetical protein